MKNPFLTVMIIPHTEQGPKAIKIPVFLLRIISITLIISLMYTFLWLYHFTYLKKQNNELKIVQSENQDLIDEYTENYLKLYQDVEMLKERILVVENLEEQVRKKNEFDPTKSYFSKQNQKVIAGIQEKSRVVASNLKLDEAKETVEGLKKAIPDKEKSLNELIKLMDNKHEKLLSVPSIYPTIGRITSRFGYRIDPINRYTKFHEGIDIANRVGTPIYATADGVVIFSGRKNGYGNMIMISHGNGYKTVYGHNYRNLAKVGDVVKKGQLIAYMGNSGRSTGPHLHYEILRYGKLVNPIKYLN